MIKRRNAIVIAVVSFIGGAITSLLVTVLVVGYVAQSAVEQMNEMVTELNAINTGTGLPADSFIVNSTTQPTQTAVSPEALENSQKAAQDMIKALNGNDEAAKDKAFSNLMKNFNKLMAEKNKTEEKKE